MIHCKCTVSCFAFYYSMSSDEDENSSRQREFQTSFEEDTSNSSQRAALYMTTSPSGLSQVTGKSSGGSDKMDISSDLSASKFLLSYTFV